MHIIGLELPTIDERHTLWLKREFDEEYYDEEFLSEIWIGSLPEPERPPEYWMKQLYRNQGIML
jgi:hypothetical protein